MRSAALIEPESGSTMILPSKLIELVFAPGAVEGPHFVLVVISDVVRVIELDVRQMIASYVPKTVPMYNRTSLDLNSRCAIFYILCLIKENHFFAGL